MILIATGAADYAALKTGSWRGFAVPRGGLEPGEVLDMLQGWSARVNAAQGWGTWLAVDQGQVVASLAVKDPVANGMVEIGYAVAPVWRGQGVATRAVTALLGELAAQGVWRVQAETAVGNPASGRVLDRCGFRRVGCRVDAEDGTLILWACDLPSAPQEQPAPRLRPRQR